MNVRNQKIIVVLPKLLSPWQAPPTPPCSDHQMQSHLGFDFTKAHFVDSLHAPLTDYSHEEQVSH